MTTSARQLIVNAIENGTVLDHIPSENLFKVVEILHLAESSNQITIGSNLDSRSFGRKGIIKIADRYFEDDELNRIALVAPRATINIIKDYKVIEKHKITIPEEVVGIGRCANPMCVTNHQKIATKFKTIVAQDSIKLLCHYCEKTTNIINL
ncbi:MAG: aspartate carbamoyltransferase regulatory subunit [Bacteroidales bacterium]|jgi:aspartate carbamoyltransferase regulatory subunit|nr:aspartate carbamoyltransferase regulatory subunit [Bacteroidales bacterium]MBR3527609.1 aspartate carbamoyltransferase regulatory subunit [Bacteroidales bacterium]